MLEANDPTNVARNDGLFHRNAGEPEKLAEPLRAAGWSVRSRRFEMKELKANPSVAVVILF